MEVALRHLSEISLYSLNHNVNSSRWGGADLKCALGTADLLATMRPASEIGSYKLYPSNFHWSPVPQIRALLSSFFIIMLSCACLCHAASEITMWAPMDKHNFLAYQKYTNRASLRSVGRSPKRQVEESNRTPSTPTHHPSAVCSLSIRTQYSLHTGNDSS